TYLYTSTINFPEGTKDIQFNQENGKVKYTLPYNNGGGFPVIWWIIIAVVVCAVFVGVFFVLKKKRT
ncbi:MAG: hypothetical protein JXA92_03280, partial [candidate division Zixibacteria bacterium]|nr:hypothetical protein [candidate division Zixibacteria bacterium]